MSNALARPGRELAVKLLGLQAVIAGILALIFLLQGVETLVSALLGGCIAIIPNAVFALYMFRYAGARAAQQIFRSMLRGAAIKLGMTMVLFVGVFRFYEPDVLALFLTYTCALLTHAIAPVFFQQQKLG